MKTAPVTPQLLDAAINGRIPLGLYAVSQTGTCKWSCLDADDEVSFQALLEYLHYHPVPNMLVERSRRGGHAFFFWKTPVPWQQANYFAEDLCSKIGIHIECYPKHGHIHAVKLPGSVHPKTNLAYPALNLATGELRPAIDLLRLVEPTLCPVTPEQCAENARCSNHPEQPDTSNYSANPNGSPDFYDLVYELSKLTRVRLYSQDRGIARCVWHDDTNPSLYLKGRRFHCLSAHCGVYGDALDVRRFIQFGTLPPKG